MTLIDAHLPVYRFRELHQLLINAAPGDLLDAVDTPGIVEDPWVQWFIRLREAPGRIISSLGYHSQLKDKPAFGLDDFTRLGRVSDREVAFGLVGRFWKFDYGLAAGVRRYPRPPDPMRLPSSVHTKELTIWGYAA
jgi:hypothetical protein